MSVDKGALFAATRALWPETIKVSDNSDATNEVYRNNETAYSQEDDWRQLALWSFHQALDVHEKRAVAKGLPSVHPHEITFEEFDWWMRSNLNGDDCWLDRRAEYEGADQG